MIQKEIRKFAILKVNIEVIRKKLLKFLSLTFLSIKNNIKINILIQKEPPENVAETTLNIICYNL